MSNIEFETDALVQQPQPLPKEKRSSKILQLIIQASGGLVETERVASVIAVLVVLSILALALIVIPGSADRLPRDDMHTRVLGNGEAYYLNLENKK